MLKELRIANIILIETAEITFQGGLNVLTGETGAGKSAVMNALSLVAGARVDSSVLRKDTNKGYIEAVFDIKKIPQIKEILDEASIDVPLEEDLVIRREITSTGKSRAFINDQLAQLSILRSIGDLLIDIVGQHANQNLLSVERHRQILDLYGDLQDAVHCFEKSWSQENNLRKSLDELISSEQQRVREIEICLMELEELNQANLKEGEDDELFAEYTFLVNAEELARKVDGLCHSLSGEKQSVINLLNKHKSSFDEILTIDPSLAETAKAYNNSLLEIQEISYTLNAYRSRIEYNPVRIGEINERLTSISHLKRKYGKSIAEILAYKKQTDQKLRLLENADTQIEDLKIELKVLEAKNNVKSANLTEGRKKVAKELEKAMIKQLRSLNMPKVEFQVEFINQKRTRYGDDFIEFYLIPNFGEHRIPIKDCASGGELSRLMLALQSILAGKEKTPTIVFDEIDANIGGETAVVVGEKLREIGRKHQVLCITHFPQVAKQADHHIQIFKQEKDSRTITKVRILIDGQRQKELARMLGGKDVLPEIMQLK